jgi:hypothetical protein
MTDGAPPPVTPAHRAQNIARSHLPIPHWVPLTRDYREPRRQAIRHGELPVRAVGTPSAVARLGLHERFPFVIGSVRAAPPDLSVRVGSDLPRRQRRVLRGVPEAHGRGDARCKRGCSGHDLHGAHRASAAGTRSCADGRCPDMADLRAAPPNLSVRAGDDATGCQRTVARGMPLSRDLRVLRGERVGLRHTLRGAERAAAVLARASAIPDWRPPDVIGPTGTDPPRSSIGAGRHVPRAQPSVLRRMPFGDEVRPHGSESIRRGDPPPAAIRAVTTGAGPMVGRVGPLVPGRAAPPDAPDRAIRHVARFERGVQARVELGDEAWIRAEGAHARAQCTPGDDSFRGGMRPQDRSLYLRGRRRAGSAPTVSAPGT